MGSQYGFGRTLREPYEEVIPRVAEEAKQRLLSVVASLES
jgi:uncharacterized protein (DUF302 family)